MSDQAATAAGVGWGRMDMLKSMEGLAVFMRSSTAYSGSPACARPGSGLWNRVVCRPVLEQVHLAILRSEVQQPDIFQLVFAVGAQCNEFSQFEGDKKVFHGFSGPGAFGKITQRLRAADALPEFIQVL